LKAIPPAYKHIDEMISNRKETEEDDVSVILFRVTAIAAPAAISVAAVIRLAGLINNK